jgi:hypothetical protein
LVSHVQLAMYIVERETLRHVVYQPFRDIVEREALRHVEPLGIIDPVASLLADFNLITRNH